MAANITLGSCVLAANGRTLTATISGGSGSGYAPASGVTKLQIRSSTGSILFVPLTATISVTTLTITLAGYIPSGSTVTVAILASSNLTDSLANTALGQVGLACTNNSTMTGTVWNSTHAGLGFTARQVNHGGLGPTAAYLETVLTGTHAIIYLADWVTGAKMFVSVDGGAEVDCGVLSTGTVENLAFPLFTGLADAAHDVTIRWSTGNNLTIGVGIIMTTSATAPTLPSRYGQTYSLVSSGFQIDDAPTTPGGGINGYSGYQVIHYPTVMVRFRATMTGIRMLCEDVGAAGPTKSMSALLWRRAVGSVGQWTEIGTLTYSDNENAYKFSSQLTGLDGSQEWEYALIMGSDTVAFYVDAITITCAAVHTGSVTYDGLSQFSFSGINQTALASQGYVLAMGDSQVSGYLIGWTDSWMVRTQRNIGYYIYAYAQPGQPLVAVIELSSFAIFTVAPKLVIVFDLSINDNISESGGTPAQAATFQTSAGNLLTRLYAQWTPKPPGIIFGILPNLSGNGYHPVTDAAWKAGNVAAGSHYTFYSMDGIGNRESSLSYTASLLDISVDATRAHFTPKGSLEIATKVLTIINTILNPLPSGLFGNSINGGMQ